MQFFQAEWTDAAVTDEYLGNVLLLYPQIKKDLVRQICEDLSLCLLNKVIGFGRTVTESQMKNTEKMSIASNKIQWTVMPWLRQLATIMNTPSGNGAANSEITFYLDLSYLTPGMVLMFQDGTGNYINIMLTSVGSLTSGWYSYKGKIVTNDPAVTFDATKFGKIGKQVGWSYDLVAACADTSVRVPVVVPNWYENFTTTSMIDRQVCSTGIQTLLWIENPDGSRCWESWEDWQMFQNFLKSWEFKGWYSTATYDTDGVINVTDQDGNQVGAGDGVFNQVANGNNISYSVATYSNPVNYEAFRTLIEDTIGSWATANGMTAGVELDLWAGFNAYLLLQRVFKDYADTPGGCCFVMDYEDGNQYEVKIGQEFRQYWFAGFKINLKKCAVFNDPSVQGYVAAGATTPWESWKFVIMPDTTCDGVPLIQYYSRAGCGTSNSFIHKVIPGTINPLDLASPIATSFVKGYTTFYNTEGVFVVNDNSKILVWKPIA